MISSAFLPHFLLQIEETRLFSNYVTRLNNTVTLSCLSVISCTRTSSSI